MEYPHIEFHQALLKAQKIDVKADNLQQSRN